MKRHLNIVLLDNDTFDTVIPKLAAAFSITLPYKNEDGRLIARGTKGNYNITVVDKKDELGEALSDEYHILSISAEEPVDFDGIEHDVKRQLEEGNIPWKEGIWSQARIDETHRRVYP